MDPILEYQQHQTRRQFFGDCGLKLGGVGLAMLAANEATASPDGEHPFLPLPGLPHFKPRAKALIYLHMNGGPTQMDLWDLTQTRRLLQQGSAQERPRRPTSIDDDQPAEAVSRRSIQVQVQSTRRVRHTRQRVAALHRALC